MSLKCAIKSLRSQTAANGDNNTAILNSQRVSQPVAPLAGTFEDIDFNYEDDINFDFPSSLCNNLTPNEMPTQHLMTTPTSARNGPPVLSSIRDLRPITTPTLPTTSTIAPSNTRRPHLQTTPISSYPCLTPPTNIRSNTGTRFPGPAGTLPATQSLYLLTNDQLKVPASSSIINPSPLTTPRRKRLTGKGSPLGLSSVGVAMGGACNDDLDTPAWTTMIRELNDITGSTNYELSKYTIAYAKKKAMKQQLAGGKIALLRVMVKSVCTNTQTISALVRDETGEMLAAVHVKVINEYKEEWGPGCCLVLRQVTVLSPTPRKHYLNITMNNIVRLYPVVMTTVQRDTRPLEGLKLIGPVTSRDSSRLEDVTNVRISDTGAAPTGSKDITRPFTNKISHQPMVTNSGVAMVTSLSRPLSSTSSSFNFSTTNIDDDFDAFFEGFDTACLDDM